MNKQPPPQLLVTLQNLKIKLNPAPLHCIFNPNSDVMSLKQHKFYSCNNVRPRPLNTLEPDC